MKKYLRMFIIVCASVSTVYYGAALYGSAQAGDTESNVYQKMQDQRSSNNKHPEEQQNLTSEQTAQVISILSKYDASNLTSEDAKAINNAFRAADIRRGPGQQQAIKAAGFDPKTISALDPPPERRESKSK